MSPEMWRVWIPAHVFLLDCERHHFPAQNAGEQSEMQAVHGRRGDKAYKYYDLRCILAEPRAYLLASTTTFSYTFSTASSAPKNLSTTASVSKDSTSATSTCNDWRVKVHDDTNTNSKQFAIKHHLRRRVQRGLRSVSGPYLRRAIAFEKLEVVQELSVGGCKPAGGGVKPLCIADESAYLDVAPL
jgi:hypothetical protein